MYKVIITFVDGHVYTRLVYANSDDHAHDIVMQGRRYAPPGVGPYQLPGRGSDVADIRVRPVCLQIHEIRDRVMAAIDSQRSGAQS